MALKIAAIGALAFTSTMAMKSQHVGAVNKFLIQSKISTEAKVDLPDGCQDGDCPPCSLKCLHGDDKDGDYSLFEESGAHFINQLDQYTSQINALTAANTDLGT